MTPGELLSSRADVTLGSLELGDGHSVMAATTLFADDQPTGPVAVVDSQGTFLGVIGEEDLRRLNKHRAPKSLLHPAAALGELYWLGLREVFGGFSSGARKTVVQGDADRADL